MKNEVPDTFCQRESIRPCGKTRFRHSAFVRFDGPIFETENSSKTYAPQGASPVGRLFRGMCVEQVCFPDSVHRFGVDRLVVDQLIADAPCPWKERFQGFASLLCQSYDGSVENWLLNESGWDGPSTM